MDADRRTAIIVGVLFVVATVASLVTTELTATTTSSDYLTGVAAHANQVKVGVVFQLVAAIAIVLIPAFLYPVLRRHSEAIAAGYLGIRTVEAVVMLIGAVGFLLLVTLSQQYVSSGETGTASYQATGAVLQGIGTWTFVLDPLVFGTGAVLFYALLTRSRLVPWWLALWGLVGGFLVVAAGLSGLFGSFQIALAAPIAVQEMALAAWLIFVGFDRSALHPGRPSPAAGGSANR
jgi:hypothetical protein